MWKYLSGKRFAHTLNLRARHPFLFEQYFYSPIAFDERVTFWLQHAGSLPCACAFAALYACAIA